jgi:ribosome-associated translation inhibitor RaiA
LTGFEVHIADENGSKKHGPADKRCTIEARPRGRDPITVEAHADDFYPAINDAAHKLRSALTSRLERD